MGALRILVCDDHDLMRRGLKALLEAKEGWTVCGEAQTGRHAVELATKLRPDVAVLDITMPQLNCVDAAKRIKKASPHTEILILSMHYSDELVRQILDAGLRGYVVKSDSDRDLVGAVETLSKHKPFFTPAARQAMLDQLSKGQPVSEPRESKLTSREREILQLLSEGKSSKEVASSLNLSVKTAETHRSNIMRKLKLHSVSELVLYALRNRIVEP
jgi:DNA-binding NarL/FixJ family response regulator